MIRNRADRSRSHAKTAARGAGLLLAGALLAGCASVDAKVDVQDLIQDVRFSEALEIATERHEKRPNDPEVQADYDLARAAWLMEEGRQLTYDSRDAEALQHFEAADALLPDHPVILRWVGKSRAELYESWGVKAFSAEASGEFEEALEAYLRALEFAPGPDSVLETADLAAAGIERVEQAIAYRAGRFEDYYTDGVRAIRRFRTAEAARDFAAALKYDDEAVDAEQRRTEVQGMLAEERLRIAAELEASGLHRAAANEYRIAQLYGPELPAALEGEARAEIEIEVLDALDEADRLLRRQRFDEAFAKLDEATAKTVLQVEEVAAARAGAEQVRLTHIYDTAIELQSDYRFEDSVAAYDELLEMAGGFYDDAISRRDTVVDFMAEAERVYGLYEAASDEKQRLRHLRNLELIWPTYKDAEARLAELRANQAPSSR